MRIFSFSPQEWAANYWLIKGTPPAKLILGMPTYGRCFQLTDATNNGVGASARGPCTAGTFTREAGFLSYYEVTTNGGKGVLKGRQTFDRKRVEQQYSGNRRNKR